ncbi:diaminohydroxyphosphoribosylaminopyrimidine deaminase [Hathewaya proteolytica DSM 3090]|uniref:Riboflavin biosynthesis protein RibD n=1 Tax=Hathewaya proteolytica DSM 3090 TaxID=1121331 RepID=A0A1M6JMG5_9CLOT|nr:bifunctional diaminohydroxyphosphoribosylaminopyrimidine deaminase/5-amino-6-(5-phosphoribosylamino)uracil reductase RibD [Hathewaya proteolytica]SHJ47876.1 diaminohydroxyphosphoribosylaminopyrimidine deaminase [Hathewaya proteolytica DSM 3090]
MLLENEDYMRRAIELAKKGEGRVNPNPLVGAVIVKNNSVIGQGYHKFFGGPHAEIEALNSATDDVAASTMYVTLEPCSHYGKTPPCAVEIVKRKIKKVVIGMEDPNPLVRGRGIEILKNAGVEVEVGVLNSMCREINEIFISYMVKKKPFVLMKYAMTLDGKICTTSGESKWISCEASRNQVQLLRNKFSSIMVGINTVLQDDPMLTCRLEHGRNPVRIIVDSHLRIPMDSNVVKLCSMGCGETIIATGKNVDESKISKLTQLGCCIVQLESEDEKCNLKKLMKELYERDIDSVLLEGGGTLNFSALNEDIVDKVQCYICPKILGGVKSKTPVEGAGFPFMKDARLFRDIKVSRCEDDVLIEAYVDKEG